MYSRNDTLQVAVLISCFLSSVFAVSRRPNIIIILTDDLGWNDVSFHGSNQIQTPNIDALAYNGIILNSHYVPALCTPSRASLLTGKYPTSMGMQHLVILPSEPWGLPLEETLMSQHFKRHGYSTHAIGKWHLGFHEKEYTPIYRGFDSHFGYWNGFQDYYDHTVMSESWKGYDMRRDLEIDYSSVGSYSTDVFTDEAVAIIGNHNSSQGPLFLYFSHLAPHSGNPDNPFQAPEEEVAKHSHIDDPERRIYAAMVTKVDESLGRIMTALKNADMLENSIVLFMTDNGAVTFGMHSNRGSNYPMRGLKESPWEGGVRGVAAIWSPLLNETKRVSNQLMHMSDWLPTLFTAAGLDKFELGNIDGMDMWNVLSFNQESPRTEVFHNYDEIENYSSLMVDSWKFIEGTAQAGDVDLWYGESGEDCNLEYDVAKVFASETNQAIASSNTEWKQSINKSGVNPIAVEAVLNLRQNSMIVCNYSTFFPFLFSTGRSNKSVDEINESFKSKSRGFNDLLKFFESKKKIVEELEKIYQTHRSPHVEKGEKFTFTRDERIRIENLIESGELKNIFECDPLKRVCLFNLKADPCERLNLANIFPDVVEALKIRLSELKKSVVKPLNQADDPFSNPDFHNGTWTNWCDVRQDKSSQLFRKLKEFAYSVSYFGYLSTLFFENVFFNSLIYQPFLIIHKSSVGVVQLNKWSLWLLGTGTIMVFAIGLAKRITVSFRYVDKRTC